MRVSKRVKIIILLCLILMGIVVIVFASTGDNKINHEKIINKRWKPIIW